MATKKKFNVYSLIYSRIKKKHPDWSHKKICVCTKFAMWRKKAA